MAVLKEPKLVVRKERLMVVHSDPPKVEPMARWLVYRKVDYLGSRLVEQ
jgi:hypothetical protein